LDVYSTHEICTLVTTAMYIHFFYKHTLNEINLQQSQIFYLFQSE
jgi:hypothetical protein